MKTCPNCGKENNDQATYCYSCGAPLNGTGEKRGTTIFRRIITVILGILVAVACVYLLFSLWDRGTDEETVVSEEPEETEAEEAEENEETVEESTDDPDELEFERSWSVIRGYTFKEPAYYRNFVESLYSYYDLSFTLEGNTLTDLGTYYSINALFAKPVTVPATLEKGEQYTVISNAVDNSTLVLTCVGTPDSDHYLVDEGGSYYQILETDESMAQLYHDSGDRMDAPFYDGILRIRKDAITGDARSGKAYQTVTEQELSQQSSWFNVVGFDDDGYVKQLIVDGD